MLFSFQFYWSTSTNWWEGKDPLTWKELKKKKEFQKQKKHQSVGTKVEEDEAVKVRFRRANARKWEYAAREISKECDSLYSKNND